MSQLEWGGGVTAHEAYSEAESQEDIDELLTTVGTQGINLLAPDLTLPWLALDQKLADEPSGVEFDLSLEAPDPSKDPVRLYLHEMGLSPLLTREGEVEIAKRLPVHMIEVVNNLIRISRRLVQSTGREPTPTEIAKQMDVPEAKIRKALKIMRLPVSLETPIGVERDCHLGELIEDHRTVSPAESVISRDLRQQTEHALRSLSPREEKVLRMRFGMDDGLERTLEEVAALLT